MKLKKLSIYLANSLWCLPSLILIRIMSPILVIRFCDLRSERIGHFVSDVAEHIARNYTKSRKFIDLYYFQSISNEQWAKMVKRSSLIVVPQWFKYLDRLNRKIVGGSKFFIPSSYTTSRDVDGLFTKFDCKLKFKKSEIKYCENWLQKYGWKKGEPIIVFLVRDSTYLKQFFPGKRDWSYHDFRNSEVESFVPAMEWLANQGTWVLRMGKVASKPILTKNNRIIDYAFEESRSDLLDIWLFTNARLVVSTGTGLDYLAGIYGIPLMYLNYLPLSHIPSFFQGTSIPNPVKFKGSQINLTLSQMLDHSYLQKKNYDANDIEIGKLNEEEILQYITEYWKIINSDSQYFEQLLDQQNLFWEIFEQHKNYDQFHNWRHPNFLILDGWLKKMGRSFLQ